MTPVDSPHVLLTRAADKLQAAADRWANATPDYDWSSAVTFIVDGYSDAKLEAAHAWASILCPAVAPHLVAWLRQTAKRAEWDYKLSSGGAGTARFIDSKYGPALRFALTVLGMEAETP